MSEVLRKYVEGDRIIWFVIVALAVFSYLVVYSATGNLAYKHHDGNAIYYLMRHAKFLMVGLAIIVVVHRMHYKWFARIANIFLYLSMLLLLITLLTGVNLNQASRWLTVPVVGISFQPSELAKLALMMYIAKVLAQHQSDDYNADAAFKPIMIHVGIICGLIFKEDFSTAGLIGATALLVMYIGRVSLKYILGTIGIFAITIFLIIAAALFSDRYLLLLSRWYSMFCR